MSQSPDGEQGPPFYLRSSLIAIRYGRNRYILFHPGSSSFTAADWLGAQAARLLVRGYSATEVARRVEQRAVGAGKRLSVMTTHLASAGAATDTRPARTLRWRLRVAGSLGLGLLLSVLSSLLRLAPLLALHLLYEALPETSIGKRGFKQSFTWMDDNLRDSGIADDTPQRRAEIARASGAVSTRLFFFLYLCLLLPRERFARFLPLVIDVAGIEQMCQHVAERGGVIAGLHTDLYFAVPIYLRMRDISVSSVADTFSLGVALASDVDIRQTFPSLAPRMIDSRGVIGAKDLLTRLRAGEVIMIAFDAPPQRESLGEAMRTVSFLRHDVRRFDGAAWLAVHSGRPLIFAGSYRRGKRTVLEMTLLRADASQPHKEQVASLTTQIYTLGETFIRQYPESWMAWSYFHTFGAVQAGEAGKQGALVETAAGTTSRAVAHALGG